MANTETSQQRQLTVWISDDLHKALRHEAVDRHEKLRVVVNRILMAAMAKRINEQERESA